jgi:hypothetical protein
VRPMKILFAVLALAPVIVLASTPSPFDGTWKSKLDAAQFSRKPDTFTIVKGTYSCATCVPAIEVKANGKDQAVTGHDYYDTISVKVLNKASFKTVRKKAGKIAYEDAYEVSGDGSSLDLKFSDLSGTEPATGEILLKRIAPAPAGTHAASGSWQYDKIKAMSDNGATYKYTATPNGLTMNTMTGQSYEAKFDGKEVPIKGDPGQTIVSLQKIGPRDVEETYKRNGKVVDIADVTISTDGKTMTYVDHDMQHQRTDTYVLEKQP